MSEWICDECGKKYGSRVPEISTFHYGWCEWCDEEKAVTESRDYGYPKLLNNK